MIYFFLIKVRPSQTFQLVEIPLWADGNYNGGFCLYSRTGHIYKHTNYIHCEIHAPSLKETFYKTFLHIASKITFTLLPRPEVSSLTS